MATPSSILAWKISWTGEPDGLQSMGHKESGTTGRLTLTYLLNHFLGGSAVKRLPAMQETQEVWV